METIKDGLKAAKEIGFLEGYNRAVSDMVKVHSLSVAVTYEAMISKLSEHYQEKMGEPMPGAKK